MEEQLSLSTSYTRRPNHQQLCCFKTGWLAGGRQDGCWLAAGKLDWLKEKQTEDSDVRRGHICHARAVSAQSRCLIQRSVHVLAADRARRLLPAAAAAAKVSWLLASA